MLTSTVVIPRERFTSLPVSLRSLFAAISPAVPVVVVEGASPPETRAELQAREVVDEQLALRSGMAPTIPRELAREDVDRVVESLLAVPAH